VDESRRRITTGTTTLQRAGATAVLSAIGVVGYFWYWPIASISFGLAAVIPCITIAEADRPIWAVAIFVVVVVVGTIVSVVMLDGWAVVVFPMAAIVPAIVYLKLICN